MNNEEQKLIENLFSRLYKAESDFPNRDKNAEQLINDLLRKQPSSSYYMTQTILVQEMIIEKLNAKILELEKNLSMNEKQTKHGSFGFLSGLFKSKKKEIDACNQGNKAGNHKDDISKRPIMDCLNNNVGKTTSVLGRETIYNTSNNSMSGFLSGSLQTAAGVAGGMVMANLLMNLFQHKRPEEEMIDQISHNPTPVSADSDDLVNNNMNNDKHDVASSDYINDEHEYGEHVKNDHQLHDSPLCSDVSDSTSNNNYDESLNFSNDNNNSSFNDFDDDNFI
ncbi:hypothetical protein bbp_170 [Buchnera aphidicola str. Bp (Baizongia pistaciae)]|uniref:Uncharacterized protein bbp_170 n=1 Tax=Buchnera aphidicola subsp. Baizongia pistaciae (strain Bp) TaxID=224915 RepID=Y170_BUCBP|nr:DUF2076 domain-containing protein [Buchnera aphidicola]Q89AS2.1 RecName: Full=Uncharacterized protein bbp_170; AltName: Full=yba2 [Buchnera aphidicola str. Bp (Baizongia pistaciae)]AAO26903.1 hypothetical protein bbp_170 [Buchnera aphidicola str. Bp (Baizongia pistaciae)]